MKAGAQKRVLTKKERVKVNELMKEIKSKTGLEIGPSRSQLNEISSGLDIDEKYLNIRDICPNIGNAMPSAASRF